MKKYSRRLHLRMLILPDTGCRISDALKRRVRDRDDSLVTLDGKVRKQCIVPFSYELRKAFTTTSQIWPQLGVAGAGGQE